MPVLLYIAGPRGRELTQEFNIAHMSLSVNRGRSGRSVISTGVLSKHADRRILPCSLCIGVGQDLCITCRYYKNVLLSFVVYNVL